MGRPRGVKKGAAPQPCLCVMCMVACFEQIDPVIIFKNTFSGHFGGEAKENLTPVEVVEGLGGY